MMSGRSDNSNKFLLTQKNDNKMGACCEVATDTDEFKKYCMSNAGYHYQPILNRVQGKIRIDEKQPYCVEGDW